MTDVLRRLEALVGTWSLEASSGGTVLATARSEFAWIEGGWFLVQRQRDDDAASADPEWAANAPFPTAWIFGLDDRGEVLTALYADARGVRRVYAMTFADRVWTLRREAPGFHQRFRGVLAEDGGRIAGTWERSADGTSWQDDFDLTYTRVT